MLRILDTYSIGKEICIEGYFNGCHFSNKENSYYVYDFEVHLIDDSKNIFETSENIKAAGNFEINDLHNVLKCRLVGKIADYKGEKQFEIHNIEVMEPVTNEDTVAFLASGIFKGVDYILAQKIVEGYYDGMTFKQGFGSNTIEIIKNNPAFLTKIQGISKTKADSIYKTYYKQISYQNISQFLKGYNLSESKIIKAYKHFREKTIESVKQNAFNLITVKGFDFKTCDFIARKMGQDPFCIERIEACIFFILLRELDNGHCYLRINDLVNSTYEKLNQGLPNGNTKGGLSAKKIESLVYDMLNRGILKCREYNSEIIIYLPEIYDAEVSVADAVKRISAASVESKDTLKQDFYIKEFEYKKGFALEEMQKEAIKLVTESNFLVLTGSAGSGKTTTVEGILFTLDKLLGIKNSEIVLAAPTGKASKRLSEVTGYEAKTVHRLLEYSKDGYCKYDKNNQLPMRVIIIDEAAMLDIFLARNLFAAIKDGTKVVLIGDIEQLPSVGAGKFLNDLIQSCMVTVVKLNVIKRQLETSGIVLNANRIINGDTKTIDEKHKDFYLVEENDECEVANKIIKSIKKLTGDKYTFSLDDIQVICPQKLTAIGTYALNKSIQLSFNRPGPEKREISKGKQIFRVGDRVIHLNNDYEARHYILNETGEYTLLETKGVFNGDIGKITGIFNSDSTCDEEDKSGIQTAVQYDGFVIIYKKYELENIDLAYALTVHKMQGSQCRVAIIPVHMKNRIMLYRNLGYTAITRASDTVCIIGQNSAVSYMVNNNVVKERNSTLNYLLKSI